MNETPNQQGDNPQSLFGLIGRVFGVSGRVRRPLYMIVGFGLMILKYACEATLIYATTANFYSPVAYLIPSLTLRDRYMAGGPDWLPWLIIIWSLPFVWIACTMSVRRSLDAGASPWIGMLVFVPFINLVVMPILAFMPSAEPASERTAADFRATSFKQTASIYSAILGLLVGGVFAVVATVLSAYTLHNYGSSLFLGMPIVSGAVAAFVYNQPDMRGVWGSIGVGALSVSIGGLGLLLFAFEGVICLVMASPLILPLGGLGGLLGWGLAKTILLQSKIMLGGALLIVPMLCLVERQFKTYQETMVESSVIIDATPEKVWQNVIAFPDIETPPAWYFRMGVASPLRARIIGSGVGAVRHCEFTTGSFVEPIKVWDEPHRLAFDVTEQPDPLIELTPYRNVRPPHLQHSFRSVQGEFELIRLADGKTKLIGRTWYSLDMGPRIYWSVWTEEIIHRIHMRVLEHIRDNSEL